MTIKNQLSDFLLIKRASQIGKMVKTIYFMRSILSIHSILYHLRVNLITNKTSMKNNKENWKNITKCYKQLAKVQMPWLAWVNTNLLSSSPKLPTKKRSKLSKCNLDLPFKHKSSKPLGPRPCQLTSIHSTKKSLLSITIKLVN